MMQTSQEDQRDVLTVGYREFYNGPSKKQWRNAGTGLYEFTNRGEGAVKVKIIPFAGLYSSKFIRVPGGNGCEQLYKVSDNSWVKCPSTGDRGIARNSEIEIIEDDLDELKL